MAGGGARPAGLQVFVQNQVRALVPSGHLRALSDGSSASAVRQQCVSCVFAGAGTAPWSSSNGSLRLLQGRHSGTMYWCLCFALTSLTCAPTSSGLRHPNAAHWIRLEPVQICQCLSHEPCWH